MQVLVLGRHGHGHGQWFGLAGWFGGEKKTEKNDAIGL